MSSTCFLLISPDDGLPEQLLAVLRAAVLEHHRLGPGEAKAEDEGSVVQLVAQDKAALGDDL